MTFIWLIIAILLMIGEIYTPGFFLFCISIGALSAAATALVTKSIMIQISIFVVIIIISVLLIRPVLNKFFVKDKKTNSQRMIGMNVVVEEEITKENKGRVKINGESWFASANETIPKGEKVIIDSIDGLTVKVHRA